MTAPPRFHANNDRSPPRFPLNNDHSLMISLFQCGDGEGKFSKFVMWNQAGSDVTGIISRSQKVAGTAQQVTNVYLEFLAV